jgi:DNA replication protein DnaC
MATKTAAQIVQAQRRTPSTPPEPVNIPAWERWAEFQTLGDPQLTRMLEATARFILAVRSNEPCPWLVLVGTSGAGKTHLARRAWRWWLQVHCRTILPVDGVRDISGQFCSFPKFIKECKGGDYSQADDLCTDRFVVLDDVGAGTEPKPWIASTLLTIIECRLGDQTGNKATIITANIGVEEISQTYDPRIASRLIRRGKEKVVQVDLPDYKMR